MSGASVKYLSHSASLVVATSIVPPPPHRGTKHLGGTGDRFGRSHFAPSPVIPVGSALPRANSETNR